MIRSRLKSVVLFLFMTFVFLLVATPAHATTFVSGRHSQQEIASYAASLGFTRNTSWNVQTDANGNPTGASLGQASSLLNLYRYVAGTSSVPFSVAYNTKCQDAATAMDLTKQFSHNLTIRPGSFSDARWQSVVEGANKSNIGNGYRTFWRMMKGMVADHTGSKISKQGHRRWMLSENMGASGAGLYGNYSALYVVDSKSDFYRYEDVAVAWPAQNQPIDLWEETSPWSLSLPVDSNPQNVSVTLIRTSDNRTWVFNASSGNFWVDNTDLGDSGAIIWSPQGLSPKAGETYNVSVRGTGAGDFNYTVSFFDAGFAPVDGGWGSTGGGSGSGGWQPAPGGIVDINGNKLVRRLYNNWTGEHHYTTDVNEYLSLVAVGWTYEGTPWMSPKKGEPVYRLYNKWSGEHFYTMDANEANHLAKAGWTREGVAWNSDEAKGRPVYRAYNPYGNGYTAHLYTTDWNEVQTLVARNGYRYEGVAWYGIAE